MPKTHIKFVCQQCGYESAKWLGRCPDCAAWNSLIETVETSPARPGAARRASAGTARALPLSQVAATAQQRQPTGSPELDRVLGGGLVAGSLVLLGGEPGIGKCVAGDTRVLNPMTGEFLPVVAWKEQLAPVLALDAETHHMVCLTPSEYHEQGKRSVVDVRTRLGRTLRCTPTHPMFTPDGWQPVGQLTEGTRVAAPRALPYFGNTPLAEPVIKLIAYMLSDGSMRGTIIGVTSILPAVESDLATVAQHFGMTLKAYRKNGTLAKQFRFVFPIGQRAIARRELASAIKLAQKQAGLTWQQWARLAGVTYSQLNTWRRATAAPSASELQRLANAAGVPLATLVPEARERAEMRSPVARLLEAMGLRFTTARTKAVPQCVFSLPRAQLALFLRTLFTCDGSVFASASGLAGVSYSTISERLAHDVQHLLLRFGFVSRLRTKQMHVNQQPYTAYEIQLLGVSEVKRFLREIGIWGREAAIAKIERMALPKLPSTHFDTIPTGPAFWRHLQLVAGPVSFKSMSRATGVAIHPGRPDRPLCRTTVIAIANAYPSPLLHRLARSGIYWDEIESITPAGEELVFDLTVPIAANFVANDLIIHNSTLMAQTAGDVALAGPGNVLYVSAEESAQQVKLRAERLGIATDRLLLLPETDIHAIVEVIEQLRPALVIVDSIQTVALPEIASAPGSISQVRECTMRLMRLAKREQIPIFLIGHVTKEGTVAGPRALEHIVDAVLYLEGERFHTYRLLRSVKNRFGATNEVGVYEMRGEGMVDVSDPSALFLAERGEQASGSAVVVSMEGTRPLLVEVQALVTTTSFGTPRCTTNGADQSRVLMLLAVLTKRVGLALGNQDVYLNVAGGFTLSEPAVDLGLAVAVASSFRERPVPPELAVLGEVGLGGELRAVTRALDRVREAARLGFKRCVLPASSALADARRDGTLDGIELVRVRTLTQAIEAALD